MRYIPDVERLSTLREEHGLSRFALSKKIGMGCSALYRIESGVTPTVQHLTADAIAKALGCKLEEVFTPANKGA